MQKINNVMWGILLIAVGVILALSVFGVINVCLFFNGWWTLFIIVPCLIGLITEKEKIGNLIGLTIGVLLLLGVRGLLDMTMIWKLILPIIIILIGIKLIFGSSASKEVKEKIDALKIDGSTFSNEAIVFSSRDINYDGVTFEGANYDAVFAGIKCDLRKAIFEKDVVIKASAIFAGVEILLPDTVKVKVNSNAIFGGVSNKKDSGKKAADKEGVDADKMITVYIDATALFGGVEIK